MNEQEIYNSLVSEGQPEDETSKELDSYLGFSNTPEEDQVLSSLEDDIYKEEPDDEDIEDYDYDDAEIDDEDQDDFFDFFESDAINYSNKVLKKNIKSGVNTDGLNGNLSNFFNAFNAHVGNGLKISSARDGKHMKGSKHYSGKGLDIGANSSDRQSYMRFKAMLKDPKLLQQAKQEFGIEDVIDEGDHIHVELMQTGGLSPFSYSSGSSNSQYPGINYNRPQDYNLPGGLSNSNNVSGYGAVLQPMQARQPTFNSNFSPNNINVQGPKTGTPVVLPKDYDNVIGGLNTATNAVEGLGSVLRFGQNAKSIVAKGLDTGLTIAGGILNERRNKRDYAKYLEEQYNEKPSDYFNNGSDYGNYNNSAR